MHTVRTKEINIFQSSDFVLIIYFSVHFLFKFMCWGLGVLQSFILCCGSSAEFWHMFQSRMIHMITAAAPYLNHMQS